MRSPMVWSRRSNGRCALKIFDRHRCRGIRPDGGFGGGGANRPTAFGCSLLGRKLIIGVDRLDYSKGIPERLRAYETLLQNYPAQRRQVTFVQISAPSRRTPEYAEIRSQVEATAGRINGRFGEFDWVPLRYINRGFTRRTLAGFFVCRASAWSRRCATA